MTDHENEFVEAYRGNVAFLLDARDALLSHPTIVANCHNVEATVACLLAQATIGAVESTLKNWKGESFANAFEDIKKKMSHKDRVSVLLNAFRQIGVEPDPELVRGFMAVKYLRNAITHGSWKQDQVAFMEKQGFPGQLKAYGEAHWLKVRQVGLEVLRCVGASKIPSWNEAMRRGSLDDDKDELKKIYAITDLSISYWQRRPFADCLVRKGKLSQVYWRNLGCVSEELAFRTKRDEPRCDGSTLADIATESWEEYFRGIREQENTSEEEIRSALVVLSDLHSRAVYSSVPLGAPVDQLLKAWEKNSNVRRRTVAEERGRTLYSEAMELVAEARDAGADLSTSLWGEGIPPAAARMLIAYALNEPAEPSVENIRCALSLGNVICAKIPNDTATRLILVQLPEIMTNHMAGLRRAAESALLLWKLRDAWYTYVESVGEFVRRPHYELWSSYDTALSAIAQKCP